MPRIRNYGARLNITEAAEDNLSPGCAWIKSRTISEAYRKMNKQVVEGESCSAIWVPPHFKKFDMARDFFAVSAGGLDWRTWRFNYWVSQGNGLQRQIDRFFNDDDKLLVIPKVAKNVRLDFYMAAVNELYEWYSAILEHSNPRSVHLFTESYRYYRAYPTSYNIHSDGLIHSRKGFRIMVGLSGDAAFLYDSTELERDSRGRDIMSFKPKGDCLTVWSPPEHAVVMVHYTDRSKPYFAAHSAKGPLYADKPQQRVLAKINANFF